MYTCCNTSFLLLSKKQSSFDPPPKKPGLLVIGQQLKALVINIVGRNEQTDGPEPLFFLQTRPFTVEGF